jgi:GH25 family lysozyme M1 (1,4-beta-N-acetylmuramidase)
MDTVDRRDRTSPEDPNPRRRRFQVAAPGESTRRSAPIVAAPIVAVAAAVAVSIGVLAAGAPRAVGAGTSAAASPAAPLAPGDLVPFGAGTMGGGLGSNATGATRPGPDSRAPGALPDPTQGARAAAEIPSTWPRGIDVASFQHPNGAAINWASVRGSGVRFAFVKATEGTSYTNPYFAADYRDTLSAGIDVGAYHYARPALPISTATSQANYFVANAGTARGLGHIAPVLDLEATGGLTGTQLRAWALTYLQRIETLTGLAPTLYTYRAFWTDDMDNTTAFTKYPLWFAIYNGASTPGALPGGWPGWRFWQHTSDGRVPGISGTVDLNVYCCTFASFPAVTDGRRSELWKRYATTAWLRSALGPLTADEAPAGGGGRWQPFERGLMYWSVDTGAREVQGGISDKYLALGGTNGFLLQPLTDETDAQATGTRQSRFRGGRIFWSHATGAHEVHGGILAFYVSLGDTASTLGSPVSDEYAVSGGRENAFQNGYVRWDAVTKAVTLIPRRIP